MNSELLTPFVNSALNVLGTMSQITPAVGTPIVKSDSVTWGAVTGVIGLEGHDLSGNMAVSFDERSILAIVSAMLMEEFTEITTDVTDAVGEITNMIAGGAKRELAEMNMRFGMATPFILTGRGVCIVQVLKPTVMQIPFVADCGEFVIEIGLMPGMGS